MNEQLFPWHVTSSCTCGDIGAVKLFQLLTDCQFLAAIKILHLLQLRPTKIFLLSLVISPHHHDPQQLVLKVLATG